MKLHEDKEFFITAVSSAAQSLGLPDVYIEKDYWVTNALKQLSQSDVRESVVFKGGTSLSKAHKLIQRFSEDIDLAAIADGFGDSRRKNLLKSIESAANGGLEYLPGDPRNKKSSKFRKSVYQYPQTDEEVDFGHVSPELLLEVNTFTCPEPHEIKSIQTMIAETMVLNSRQDLIDKYELGPFELKVLSVQRTMIEKLLGVIKDSYSEDPITRFNKRIRHIYDLCMILKVTENRSFVRSSGFNDLCQRCLTDELELRDEKDTAYLKEPLHTAPLFKNFDQWWSEIENTYRNSFSELVYGELPKFETIKEMLAFLHGELKKLK